MPKINYTNSLQNEYTEMFKSLEITLTKLDIVDQHIKELVSKRERYETVGNQIGVPWYFIGLIHTLESNRNFNSHLHNGDPLTKRTTHVPRDRPRTGRAPFSWEESALDALKLKRLHKENDWSLPRILYQLENYNGWGYRLFHTHVKSPYLWSYSNHYISGKYKYDGVFSNSSISRQCGAAVLLRRLEQKNIIPEFDKSIKDDSFFFYSKNNESRVDDLQRFLNTFPGISLLVDNNPGKMTSAACKAIFGNYLNGDSRIK